MSPPAIVTLSLSAVITLSIASSTTPPKLSMPRVEIPPSTATMKVSIIDSTGQIVGPAGSSIMPTIPGQPTFNFDTYCFLLEHEEKSVLLLYDAGSRVDWWNLSPGNVEGIQDDTPGFRVTKSINQVLQDGGVDDQSINAIIWSHSHFDHVGDSSLFPPTTDIIVGPGFREELMPGFPTDPNAIMLDSDFAGHFINEMDFKGNHTVIGGFRAIDYFGDGALFLLDTPGHATGHLSALVRTTPDTFILLGGDICDAPQVLRPTTDNPLPSEIDPQLPRSCPCTKSPNLTERCGNERTMPFSLASNFDISYYEDPATSQRSINTLQRFDADPNILVALAHDRSLRSVLRFFPDGTINDWKDHGWKGAVMWGFLKDLPLNGKQAENQPIVDGLYRDGVKLRSGEEVLETLDPDTIGRCKQGKTL